ncbi:MAG TPA: TPM domain-containing protein [Candidatus Manganitrophaceae bacterium]|nr:TPM domain-containing protein [Candidatus Manganitrophaceae bacterium]
MSPSSRISLLIALFLSASIPFASALEIPPLEGRVNDRARLLSPEQVQSLEAKLQAYEEKTTNQIALLTLPGLEGEPLEDYTIRVARAWRLGQEKRNNGVLILVAAAERAIRIEVGYGLEGALTDAQSSAIIRNIIVPAFQQGDFYRGIDEGIDAIESAVAGEFQADRPAGAPKRSGRFNEMVTIGLILLVLFSSFLSALPLYVSGVIGGIVGGAVGLFLAGAIWISILVGFFFGIFLSYLFRSTGGGPGGWGGRYDRGSGWSGGRGIRGGFGGGGFSGGGGSFGGGGASGRW